jgi:hypothetical protein
VETGPILAYKHMGYTKKNSYPREAVEIATEVSFVLHGLKTSKFHDFPRKEIMAVPQL